MDSFPFLLILILDPDLFSSFTLLSISRLGWEGVLSSPPVSTDNASKTAIHLAVTTHPTSHIFLPSFFIIFPHYLPRLVSPSLVSLFFLSISPSHLLVIVCSSTTDPKPDESLMLRLRALTGTGPSSSLTSESWDEAARYPRQADDRDNVNVPPPTQQRMYHHLSTHLLADSHADTQTDSDTQPVRN